MAATTRQHSGSALTILPSAHDFAGPRNVIPHARGTFRRLNKHGAERATGFEVLLHLANGNGVAVRSFDHNGFDAVRFRQLDPAFAEFSRGPDQNAVAGS